MVATIVARGMPRSGTRSRSLNPRRDATFPSIGKARGRPLPGPVAQKRQDLTDPVWQRTRKGKWRARDRMSERQARRVERYAAEPTESLGDHGIPGRRTASSPVRLVPEQRMPERSQVHADLVRAPGLEPALEERDRGGTTAEALQHAEPGHRPL